jgi:hypothetical protein
MIQVYNTESPFEKYIFDIISINTGISFKHTKSDNSFNRASINYFQTISEYKGNTIYIYNSSQKLNDIESPKYLYDPQYPLIKIPVFYSKSKINLKNILFKFSDNSPAILKGYDDKKNLFVVVNFDLIKNIGYHLTRFEEYESPDKDSFNRYPSDENTLYKYNVHEFPVVDYYINLLFEHMNLVSNEIISRKKIWPDEKKYAVCLSHDVDAVKIKTIFRFLFRTYLNIMSDDKLKDKYLKFKELCKIYGLKEDIFDNFNQWIEIESKYGFHSSFYFLSRKMFESLISKDRRYSIKKRYLQRKIKEIHEKKWEVGLHGFLTSDKNLSQEKILLESMLGSKIIGVRQHYLRISIPDTWDSYRGIGLKYDSSLGFADAFGFRAGTSYPFLPFNLKSEKKIDLLIIPLTIMDTCFLQSNSKNLFNEIMDKFIKFKDMVANFGGVMTLLWHQEYYNDYEYPFFKESYREILSILNQDNDVYVGSGLEIYNAWLGDNVEDD